VRWSAWLSSLLEECASLIWATNDRRRGREVILALLAAVFVLEILPHLGVRGVAGLVTFLAFIVLLASDVTRARRLLWVAATRRFRNREPLEIDTKGIHAPTAVALRHLAVAVDAARRGQVRSAQEQVGQIDRTRLRPNELRLLDAVRAVVSLHLGERARAARQAVLALPTGSPDLDQLLGRTVFADAWQSRPRLSAIDDAWERAGVRVGGDQALSRLRQLLRVRLEAEALDDLRPEDARSLAAEAEAIGDAELARDLHVASRQGRAYR
jgi:hypothetical protein